MPFAAYRVQDRLREWRRLSISARRLRNQQEFYLSPHTSTPQSYTLSHTQLTQTRSSSHTHLHTSDQLWVSADSHPCVRLPVQSRSKLSQE